MIELIKRIEQGKITNKCLISFRGKYDLFTRDLTFEKNAILRLI